MKPTIDIKGFKEAKAILDQLPNNMQKRMIRQTLRSSSKPMLAAARRNAPKKTGILRKMLRTVNYRKVTRRSEVAIAIKHVFGKTKNDKINQYYGKFVHEGTKERVAKKGAVFVFTNEKGEKVFTRRAKAMTPNPYLERAYENNVDGLVNNFGSELARNIDKFIAKNFKPIS